MRSEGKFYDDKNFPRGFDRSGVFTISEASILESYGRAMSGLQTGTLSPIDDNEMQFLTEIQGKIETTSEYGQCWRKYLAQTGNKVRSYTLCASQRKSSVAYDEDTDEVNTESDFEY